MNQRRLLGLLLLFGPIAIAGGVGISKYEWIWNRTNYAIPISCAVALLMFLVMGLGLYLTSDSRGRFIPRVLTLATAIGIVQFFNVALDGAAHAVHSAPLSEGRTAFAVRYAALGSSWTDVHITQAKWFVLRETYHVRQYELAAVAGLQAYGDGGLQVGLREIGKAQMPKFDVFTSKDLQRISAGVDLPSRL